MIALPLNSIFACLISLAVISPAAMATNTIHSPQNVPVPGLVNNELNYKIPSVPERVSIEGDRFGVKGIHLVEVLGVKSDGILDENEFGDDRITAMIRQRIAQAKGLMTVGELQNLAGEISEYLKQERDFLLATVYVPVQKVDQGVVKFALLKGKLGQVEITENSVYTDKIIADAFAPYIGEVVKKGKAEEILLGLQDLPGFFATGNFSVGEKLGFTKLTLKATEQRFKGMAFIDDAGSEFTGRIRGGTRFSVNNLMNMKDQLSVLVYASQTPDGVDGGGVDCCDGSLTYEFGLDDDNQYRGGLEVSKADYDVGNVDDLTLATFGFRGETLSINAYGSYQLTRGRERNAVIRFSIAKINAKTRRLNQLLSEDKITAYESSYDFGWKDSYLAGGDNSGRIGLSTGKLSRGKAGNSRLEADKSFNKLSYSFNRRQQLIGAVKLDIRVNGQYSQNQLVGVQQMGIGGPTSVRAYPTGAFLADKGTYAALDFIWQNALAQGEAKQSLDPYVFVDYASAKVVEGETFAVKQVNLGSYGLGLNWRYAPFSFGLTAARALGSAAKRITPIAEGGRDVTGRKNTQFFASMKYEF